MDEIIIDGEPISAEALAVIEEGLLEVVVFPIQWEQIWESIDQVNNDV